MKKNSKKEKELKRTYHILLSPDAEAQTEIDKKMTLCQRLYTFLQGSIRRHISYLVKRTSYGSYFQKLADANAKISEINKKIRELSSNEIDNKEEIKELKKEISKIKKDNKELFTKKCEFFRNDPDTLLRVKMISRRVIVYLQDDCMTPIPDSGFELKYGTIDNKLYYVHKKINYQLVPGSVHKTSKGIRATLCECIVKSVPAVYDEELKRYTYKDKVWERDAVIKSIESKVNKNGNAVYSLKHIFPIELFRIDSSLMEYKSFCEKFSTERVHSVNKNPKTKKTQKTGYTYSQMSISSSDLKYSIGNRLYMSYKEFPYEREHTVNEYDLFTSGNMSTTIMLNRDENMKFSVLFKPSSKRTLTIPVNDSPNNKSRHYNPEYNFDLDILNASFLVPGYKSYSIIRKTKLVRDCLVKKYYLGVSLKNDQIPRRLETENTLNRTLGKGIIGIDPNAHMIAAVSGCGTVARIFSYESVAMNIYKKIEANENRITELQKKMNVSMKECNPKSIDADGRYIKGCGISIFKSRKFRVLKKEIADLHARNVRLKKVIVNMIAHEILGMGDTVYSELPATKEKAVKKEGIKKNENGKILSNHGNGRSVQKFAIAGLMEEVRQMFIRAGGKWFWISDYSRATSWKEDGKIEHTLNDRVLEFFGYRVQRDLKSAFCLSFAILGQKMLNDKGEPKLYRGEPIYHATFDVDCIKAAMENFVRANNEEMLRLKNIGVEESTVGVKAFFGEETEAEEITTEA